MATFKFGGPYRVSKAREKKVSYGRIACGTIPDRMTPKSAQSAKPTMLQPCLHKQGSKRVIFRSGQNRGQNASIPTNLAPKFRALDALQTLL